MPSTADLLLPYPALSDAPSGPGAIQALADKLESTLFRQGLAAARGAAASWKRTAFWSTDTGALDYSDGTTWQPVTAPSVPRGTLTNGYAQSTTLNQGSITSPAADLTGLTVTVTVGSGRRIRITGACSIATTVGTDTIALLIRESSTQVGGTTQGVSGAGFGVTVFASCILTPSAGAHTYKLSGFRAAGSGTLTATGSVGGAAYILAEDIGV